MSRLGRARGGAHVLVLGIDPERERRHRHRRFPRRVGRRGPARLGDLRGRHRHGGRIQSVHGRRRAADVWSRKLRIRLDPGSALDLADQQHRPARVRGRPVADGLARGCGSDRWHRFQRKLRGLSRADRVLRQHRFAVHRDRDRPGAPRRRRGLEPAAPGPRVTPGRRRRFDELRRTRPGAGEPHQLDRRAGAAQRSAARARPVSSVSRRFRAR